MIDTFFIISQILMGFALISDIFSFQFKNKKKIIIFFIISAFCISAHYFFLNKKVAGFIVILVIIRYIIAYFSTKKIFIYFFLFGNTLILYYFYTAPLDFINYIGNCIHIFALFQKDKILRKIMMIGTLLIILYDILIFSPMGVVTQGVFLLSNILGYYKYYIRKNKKSSEK
jgi:hypothetical protein